MKSIVAILVLMTLWGCATAYKMNKVGLGMTKQEVIQAIGKPVSVSAQGNAEFLHYKLSETSDDAFYGWTRPYYVRLVDGKVESYGRMGDFDSTKDPRKIIVEREDKIQADVNMSGSSESDMYSELMKIKQLKDEGLLTEEEFQTEKKEILEKY
jgi:outer membrane protein assembly factor BamE (lipoprotein component of BamABCDE complex)